MRSVNREHGKRLRPIAQVQRIESDPAGFVNRVRQGGGALPVRVEHAVAAVLHHVEDAAAGHGDHRRAAGEGLDGGDAEVLDPGLEEEAGAAVEVAQLLRADLARGSGRCGPAISASRSRSGPSPTIRSSSPSFSQAAMASSTFL